MDRYSIDESGKKQLIYQEALEFIGEVRAGISWDRFCMYAIRYSDVLINMLNDAEDVQEFLSLKGIGREYVHTNIRNILARLHFNRENDHYLTLSLPRNASEAQIHTRWRDLMLIYHPDRSNDEDAARCAKKINEAYSVLKNPEKKMEYDGKLLKSGEAHFKFKGHTRRNRQILRPQRHLFISPKMRRLFPKLIIPSCIVISCLVLLVIFLKNRQESYTYHVSAPPKETNQDIIRADRTADMKEGETKGEKGKELMSLEYSKPPIEQFYKSESSQPEKAQKDQTEKDNRMTRLQASRPSRSQDVPLRETRFDDRSGRIEKTLQEKAEPSSVGTTVHRETPDKDMKKDVVANIQQESPSYKQQGQSNEISAAGTSPAQGYKEDQEDLEKEVYIFLAQYIHTYEEGDIARFMDFFSKSAIENNSLHYGEIKQFYKKNFERNRYKYILKNLQLQKRENDVVVTGDYSIKKLPEDDKGAKTKGTIRWTLSKENGGLKIVRIDYDRR